MKRIFFVYTILFSILIVNTLHAQIFVHESAAGTGDGTSWENAFTTITDAIASSEANDELWIAEGKYTPEADTFLYFKHDLVLLGGFKGDEKSPDDRNPNINQTILSGDILGDDSPGNFDLNKEDNAIHIIYLDTFITNLTLFDGLIFEFGNTVGENGAGNDRRGGAILAYGAPVIKNCTFRENFGWFGGAIYPRFGFASGILIESCNFVNNFAGAGGAIYINSLVDGNVRDCYFSNNRSVNNGSAIYNQNSIDTIANCFFEFNNTTSRGGIYNTGNGLVEILDCTFENNKADDRTGAGIHNANGTIHINGCTFDGNSSTWGGAMTSYGSSTIVDIENCSFINNNANSLGGAMSIGFQATVNVSSSEFANNISNGGGAIFMQNDSSSLNMTGSTVTENIANGSGGGISAGAGVMVNIDQCLFYDNDGEFGGALSMSEDSLDLLTVNISNTEFTLNSASAQGGALNFNDANATLTNCLLVFNEASGAGTGGAISNNGSTEVGSDLTIINSTLVLNSGNLVNGIAQWTSDTGYCILNLQNTILANDGNYLVEAGSPLVKSIGGNISNDASMLTDLSHAKDLNETDPLFVDLFNLDFHLQKGSPCIDGGISDGAPSHDIEGNARIGDPDMGAYEYTGAVNTKNDLDILFRADAYPSIFQDYINLKLAGDVMGNVSYYFVNIKGQKLQHGNIQKSSEKQTWRINTSALGGGNYWLVIEQGQAIWSKPVILKR